MASVRFGSKAAWRVPAALARTGAACLLAASCAMPNVGGLVSQPSALDQTPGKFIDTVKPEAIDYRPQQQARAALMAQAPSLPVEMVIGPINRARLTPGQTAPYDREAELFMHQIASKLLAKWPGTKPDYRIVIVDDSPQASFMAEADLDGTMFFGRTLISELDSTDELAFLEGHELAHVLLAHGIRGQEQQQANDAGNQAPQQLAKIDNDTSLQGNVGQVKTAFLFTLNNVLEPAFTRQQEGEADLLATDMMVRAGYSPRAVSQVMQRLEYIEQQMTKAEDTLRAANMDAQQKKTLQQMQTGTPSAPTTGGLFAAASPYLGMILHPEEKRMERTHPPALSRDQDLNIYLKREYAHERMTQRVLQADEYVAFKQRMTDELTPPVEHAMAPPKHHGRTAHRTNDSNG